MASANTANEGDQEAWTVTIDGTHSKHIQS